MRRAAGCVAVLAAITAPAALAVPTAQSALTRPQVFFRDALLRDRATSTDIKTLLRSGGGFVVKQIVFRDLTGDDKSDAIVRVHSGGAQGVVAVYVFSTDSGPPTPRRDDELRAVFRSQKLRRAATRVSEDTLSYRTARYAPGDDVCCPSRLIESTLEWDDEAHRLTVAERVEVDGEPPAD